MKRVLIVLIVLTGNLHAQKGVFGKNNLIEISGVGAVPVIANIIHSTGDEEKKFNSWQYGLFSGGGRISYTRILTESVGLSLEGGLDSYSYSYTENDQRYKNKISSFSLMPKIEFTGKKNLYPIGLSHQIGLGYYTVHSRGGNDFPYDLNIKGGTLMYAMIIRNAVSDKLILNYGVRYTLNIPFSFEVENNNFYNYYLPDLYDSDGFNKKSLNFLSLQVGLSYSF